MRRMHEGAHIDSFYKSADQASRDLILNAEEGLMLDFVNPVDRAWDEIRATRVEMHWANPYIDRYGKGSARAFDYEVGVFTANKQYWHNRLYLERTGNWNEGVAPEL